MPTSQIDLGSLVHIESGISRGAYEQVVVGMELRSAARRVEVEVATIGCLRGKEVVVDENVALFFDEQDRVTVASSLDVESVVLDGLKQSASATTTQLASEHSRTYDVLGTRASTSLTFVQVNTAVGDVVDESVLDDDVFRAGQVQTNQVAGAGATFDENVVVDAVLDARIAVELNAGSGVVGGFAAKASDVLARVGKVKAVLDLRAAGPNILNVEVLRSVGKETPSEVVAELTLFDGDVVAAIDANAAAARVVARADTFEVDVVSLADVDAVASRVGRQLGRVVDNVGQGSNTIIVNGAHDDQRLVGSGSKIAGIKVNVEGLEITGSHVNGIASDSGLKHSES